MDKEKDPLLEFVATLKKMMIAVAGQRMAKEGLIGKYPENFDKEVAECEKAVYDFLASQDPNGEEISTPTE